MFFLKYHSDSEKRVTRSSANQKPDKSPKKKEKKLVKK